MKKVLIIISLLIICFSLSSCKNKEYILICGVEVEDISPELENEILDVLCADNLFIDRNKITYIRKNEYTDYTPYLYYGTYNGYSIIATCFSNFEGGYYVGKYNLEFLQISRMIAYKKGIYYCLEDAYLLGYISDDDLDTIAKIHYGRGGFVYENGVEWKRKIE